MIRSLMLIVLLGIMVVMARGNPGALPEAARSAGAAIEDQIRRTASAAADPSPVETMSRPAVERRQVPSVEERPLPKPPVSRPPAILHPAAPPAVRAAGPRDDGPPMPAVPRIAVALGASAAGCFIALCAHSLKTVVMYRDGGA